ncbi:hypothetical protein GOP47_0014082 [Adiantum capillus-veneris]|uniref:Uncharacterized protein n=1 Tax=Adiantum capillus-veneris TaxID=13818 RepID=A0A9D4ZGE1_ADICA|nr:hypothetical protein GOP47_0014082 [Adiantum capillus-veneris]
MICARNAPLCMRMRACIHGMRDSKLEEECTQACVFACSSPSFTITQDSIAHTNQTCTMLDDNRLAVVVACIPGSNNQPMCHIWDSPQDSSSDGHHSTQHSRRHSNPRRDIETQSRICSSTFHWQGTLTTNHIAWKKAEGVEEVGVRAVVVEETVGVEVMVVVGVMVGVEGVMVAEAVTAVVGGMLGAVAATVVEAVVVVLR